MLNKTRLLTPGPTPLPEEVRLAMARDMLHHRKPAFLPVMEDVRAGLKYLFQTSQEVIPLACSGTGAMAAAVTNLFTPGEKLLCVEGGKFGERWGEICEMHGQIPVRLPVEWGRAVDPADVARALDADPSIRGVLVQASETSTGVLHPIGELGRVTAGREALLVADGISAVGISPCPMDAWGVDCLLTGSQKGLMLPPGLAFIACSEKGWAKCAQVRPSNFYFQLQGEHAKIKANQTMFTSPVGLLIGLRESLRLFREFGLERLHAKQWALTMMARAGASAMGLELLAPENFTWGLTSIRMPLGVSASEVAKRASADHGVVLATGQGHMKDRVVRLGHMGHVDFGDVLAGLAALRQAFTGAGGYIGCPDALEQAMDAYGEALRQGPPAN
ncbi:Serine-pyruvate aminotransferase [Fundidesulfovibrio magnetotacticus]|uniref:Serine-pyruvate aminotransferase n=1 Tax=Fundidesulfovibrio magnetotacticus TaxID=2730080 RepID=A0A6V8LSQ4_9BACT|nr:alanine--glyoxylate aminotransferase family protein [Fundidesulfovibrio magnetotacticus]GFK93990.1 Serine-pyruvate aminotransferase [Fundidesulfovibrio magnetotacticus]